MRFMTKGSDMQRHARRSSVHGSRKHKLTHACRPFLIDQLESRVLLSTGGTPDPGFGQGGYLKGYQVLAAQQDGSLIARNDGKTANPLVLLNPDGSLEGPYSGPAPTPPPTNVQSDGKYLIINGNSWASGNTLSRFNPDGSYDTSFGNNGTVSNFTTGTNYAFDSFNPEIVTVVGTTIVVGGMVTNGSYHGLAMVTLSPNGSPAEVAPSSLTTSSDVKSFQIIGGTNDTYFMSGEVAGNPQILEFYPWEVIYGATIQATGTAGNVYGMGLSENHVYLLADSTPSFDVLAAYDLRLNPDTGFGNNGQVQVIPPDHLTSNPPVSFTGGRLIVRDDERVFVSNNYTFADGTSADYVISYLPDWGANTSVSGYIYQDANFNGIHDSGDQPLRYWKVYVDLNENGIEDAYEPTAYTDYNGYYKIHGLQPGTYNVAEIQQVGWTATSPSDPSYHTFTVSTGQVATGSDFGNDPTSQMGTITGSVYYDTGGSGGSAGIPNWPIYVDLNNNGILDPNEPSTTTGQSGNFTINTGPGTRVIRALPKVGWTQTQPASGTGRTVTVTAGATTSGVIFGETEGNTLDSWFANNGTLAGYTAQQVLPDGKILAHDSGGNLVRLNPDGSVDSTFNPATDVPPTPLPGVYQSDGKRLVLDTTNSTITRYNTDGSIDSTFATNGTFSNFAQQPTRYLGSIDPTLTPYQNTKFTPKMIALQGSEIIVLGTMDGQFANGNPIPTQLAVERLSNDGYVDPFGVVVYVASTNFPMSFLNGLYVANSGLIYIVAEDSGGDPRVIQIGTDGTVGKDVPLNGDYISGSAMGPDGRLVVVTEVDNLFPKQIVLVTRLNADLSADPSLDHYQVILGTNYSPDTDYITSNGNPMIGADDKVLINATDNHNGQNVDYLVRFSATVPNGSGSVSGYIYNDANGNGVHDSGDSPIRYAQAFIDLNGNGTFDLGEPTAYADYNGFYKIYGIAPGTYQVYEVAQAGYTEDAPSATPYQTVTVTAGNTATGADFGNRQGSVIQPGSISGTFFYDSNTNGVWDSGEVPSPYWGVYIDANSDGKFDSGDTEVIANGAGQYTFKNLAPGTYIVRGTTASGWTQTFPANGGAQTVTVGSGQAVTGINFGEFHGTVSAAKGSISGTFFYDSNHNGVWDSGEPISPYWGVYIDANNDGKYDSGDTELICNGQGQFTFPNLPVGTYVIRGTTASGWTQTFPANGGAQVITLAAGQNVSNINFGEYHGVISATGSISGTFFNDGNANGQNDSGETPLADWQAFVDLNGNGIYDAGEPTAYSDNNGYYKIDGIAPGTYRVYEVLQAGWTRTQPPSVPYDTVTVSSGQVSTGNDFGNTQLKTSEEQGTVAGYLAQRILPNGIIVAQDLSGKIVGLYPDGTLDPSFNPATDIPPAPLPGIYQPDGKRLVLDTTNSTITRYNVDGSIDYTFGTNGTFSGFAQTPTRYLADPSEYPFQDTTFVPQMIVLQGNNIVVLGDMNGKFSNGFSFSNQVAVERITSNGLQDYGFGVVACMTTFDYPVNLKGLYVANSGQIYIVVDDDVEYSWEIQLSSDGTTGNVQQLRVDVVFGSAQLPNGNIVIEGWIDGGYPTGVFQVLGADWTALSLIPNFDPTTDWFGPSGPNGGLLTGPDGSIYMSLIFYTGSNQIGGYYLSRFSDGSDSISGYIYYDANGNGVIDSSEPPLRYAQAFVDLNGNGKYDPWEPTGYADSNGYYQIGDMPPGTYKVYEVTPAGYTQDAPSVTPYRTVTVTAGNTTTGVDFGNRAGSAPQPGSISGTFFYDSNHNGVWDSGEPISPYWGVYIDANNDGKYDSGDTEIIANGQGQFTFPNLPAGTYVIRGTTASGWTQTSPANGGAQIVTIVAGQNLSNINFGEYHGVLSAATGSISGTFFYDSNANGIWDAGETDSPSWGVYIDANDDGVYDSGDTELIANTHGQYTFSNLSAGTYVIRATTASGWKQTYPANGGAQVITLASGQNATGINFGKVRT